MTLTEQWKKGELPDGKKYYITFLDSEPFEATFRAHKAIIPFWKFEAHGRQYCDEIGCDCVKVLAPVPTFEEWQTKLEENAQLKELLRECKSSVLFEADVMKETSGKHSKYYKMLASILTKIDNAIGEKK